MGISFGSQFEGKRNNKEGSSGQIRNANLTGSIITELLPLEKNSLRKGFPCGSFCGQPLFKTAVHGFRPFSALKKTLKNREKIENRRAGSAKHNRFRRKIEKKPPKPFRVQKFFGIDGCRKIP